MKSKVKSQKRKRRKTASLKEKRSFRCSQFSVPIPKFIIPSSLFNIQTSPNFVILTIGRNLTRFSVFSVLVSRFRFPISKFLVSYSIFKLFRGKDNLSVIGCRFSVYSLKLIFVIEIDIEVIPKSVKSVVKKHIFYSPNILQKCFNFQISKSPNLQISKSSILQIITLSTA